ncbi:MAG TPA: hypothetical protein VFN74_07450 [Chloroflexota bacterium]|nr:hypothetical protein [Chloroflexota bacterium]
MKKEFIVERNGKSFVLYAGLLDQAHERGLKAVTTTLVQIPSDLNGQMAIVHATVETTQGTFTGLGDAAPDNVSRMMVPHLIRMAETRAKARALRDAVNVGVTALEELGDLDEHGSEPAGERSERHEEREPVLAGRSNGRANGSANGHVAEGRSLRALEPRDVEAAPANGRPGAAPATPKQLQTIQRMSRASGKQIPAENLTRAQASEIISTLIGEMDQRAAS